MAEPNTAFLRAADPKTVEVHLGRAARLFPYNTDNMLSNLGFLFGPLIFWYLAAEDNAEWVTWLSGALFGVCSLAVAGGWLVETRFVRRARRRLTSIVEEQGSVDREALWVRAVAEIAASRLQPAARRDDLVMLALSAAGLAILVYASGWVIAQGFSLRDIVLFPVWVVGYVVVLGVGIMMIQYIMGGLFWGLNRMFGGSMSFDDVLDAMDIGDGGDGDGGGGGGGE